MSIEPVDLRRGTEMWLRRISTTIPPSYGWTDHEGNWHSLGVNLPRLACWAAWSDLGGSLFRLIIAKLMSSKGALF